ncbi:Uncharacterised protein [Mycobacteroides abscessus subsp. abscessus]|nr:Uncharacterised protein [Mycobacteroides abscessus subsp. abscessus]
MGASNSASIVRFAFRAVLIAATTRIAPSELPPRSKNDSSTPTRSTPSTWAKMLDRICSFKVAGRQ